MNFKIYNTNPTTTIDNTSSLTIRKYISSGLSGSEVVGRIYRARNGVIDYSLTHGESRGYGGTGADNGNSISVDNLGNIYITGEISSALDFGGGAVTYSGTGLDAFVLKLDSNGNHVWSKGYGLNPTSTGGVGVDVDSNGNVYVTGYISGNVDFGGGALTNSGNLDIFVLKLDTYGNHVWSYAFGVGAGNDIGHYIDVDSSGNVYVTGQISGAVDFGGGAVTHSTSGSDIFVLKLDTDGTHVWSSGYGGTGDDIGYGISVDSSGNVHVVGKISSAINFGGGAVSYNAGEDIFVLKLDSSGTHVWSNGYGGSLNDLANSVDVDSSGNVYVTGYIRSAVTFGTVPLTFVGNDDIFILKLDSDGSHVWSKSYGGGGFDAGYDISTDSTGNVYVVGGIGSAIDFGGGAVDFDTTSDIFLLKLDTDGNHLFSRGYGGGSGDIGRGVHLDAIGNIYATGTIGDGNVDFGGGNVSYAGTGSSIFMLKLDATSGTPVILEYANAFLFPGSTVTGVYTGLQEFSTYYNNGGVLSLTKTGEKMGYAKSATEFVMI